MNRAILIMAGGTGGHIYPALAVAEELRRRRVVVHWLGTRRGLESRLVPQAGLKLHTVTVTGLRRRGLRAWLLAPPVLILALLQSLWHLLMLRPAAVLGMGGFACGPGGVAAWLLRIPLLLHEQNALPGTTNRLLAPLAWRLLEAFPDAFAPRPAVCTGNPVRDAITRLPTRPGRARPGERAARILVVGGSQGAAILNRVVPAALALLAGRPDPPRLEVWHQTGVGQDAETTKRYQQHGVVARVEPYLHAIEQAYAWADLVICRAGAMTIAELTVVGLAALLVPYPFAVDDHQTANAQYLAKRGAALLVPEQDLTPPHLAELVRGLIDQPERRAEMARQARVLGRPNAALRVAELCLEAAYG